MNFALIVDDSTLPRWRHWVEFAQGQIVDLNGPLPVDVVIVAGDVTSARTVVPELVRQGKTVWLVPESILGSEFIYEMIPLDEEFPRRLHGLWPLRQQPAVMELKRQLRDRGWGHVLHLQLERTSAGGPFFTPDQAHAAWLHDADLLRHLVSGDYQRVTAIHSGISPHGITTASVSLSGDGVPDAMWAYRSGGESKRELTVTTDHGSAVLTWLNDAPPTLSMNCQPIEIMEVNPCPESGGVTPWTDAVRAIDLLDAARRSLTRRRTVELQFESTSERSQFKTQMTAIGCMLLLLTMFGLIGLLFAGRMLDPRDAQQKQAEVAGFVLTGDHFDGAQLNPRGREVMSEITENYHRRSATILIEGEPSDELSATRRELVVSELSTSRLAGAEIRTLVRPLGGRWFKRAMTIAWVILFLPLGIMLALQLLIGFTSSGDRNKSEQSANPS